MIILGVFFLPTNTAVFSTISIVFLTVCLICCLRVNTLIYECFKNPRIVKIGLISYSLYLWHWGVLSISRWTIGIHWWSVPFQLLTIYFLSLYSYKWIEIPFRNNNWSYKKWRTIIKGILTLISSFVILNFMEGFSDTKLFLGKTQSLNRGRYFETFKIDNVVCRFSNVEYTF